MCPRPEITDRSAERAAESASHTASKAAEWPPETTSTGKPADASRSSGISASQDGRSSLQQLDAAHQLLRELAGSGVRGAGAEAEEAQEVSVGIATGSA